jgi:hypothetical protein
VEIDLVKEASMRDLFTEQFFYKGVNNDRVNYARWIHVPWRR